MDWIYKYISVTAIIGGLWFLIRYLIQKKIDSYFNKQLETYKQELAIITEQAKYDVSKKLFDFEAYASKKHVVYPELYSQAFEPWQELVQLSYRFDVETKISRPDLEGDELITYFNEKVIPITSKILNAHDYFFKNELYLSKNASTAFGEALDAQFDFREAIESSFLSSLENVDQQDPHSWSINVDEEDFNKVREKIHTLKDIIYKELSYTHFEEAEKKEEALS